MLSSPVLVMTKTADGLFFVAKTLLHENIFTTGREIETVQNLSRPSGKSLKSNLFQERQLYRVPYDEGRRKSHPHVRKCERCQGIMKGRFRRF